jgi:microtubule-associated protein-like 6
MGIWPPCTDGTDIKAVDVFKDKSLVVTGADSGQVALFNYPCVVKNAPSRSYGGHSSFVTNVRFLYGGSDDLTIISLGGRDRTVFIWRVEHVSEFAKKPDYTTNIYGKEN